MRRIIAALLVLVFAFASAQAEEAVMPEDVRAFFALLDERLAEEGLPQEGEAAATADINSYVAAMPSHHASFALSRLQYDSWYCRKLSDNVAVSVLCINGRAAAYILDLDLIYFVAGEEVTHAALSAFADAYLDTHPETQRFYRDDLLAAPLFDCMYDPSSSFASHTADYGDTVFSAHIISLGQRTALQLFPTAAYDGAAFGGEPLSAALNHELSAYLALQMEYTLVNSSLR